MAMYLTRRRLLSVAGAGVAGVILASCKPEAVEKIVEQTVVVKETVVIEGTPQVVEKVVEKVVTAVPPTTVPTEADTGPLKIMWVSQVALVESFQQYSDNTFTPNNNGAKVEITIVPSGEFSQKLLSGVAAGDPPDIFREVNYAGFAHYCEEGVILSLDDLIARDGYQTYLDSFLPGSLDAGKFEGQQYCIPFGGHPSSYFLFYNKTALNEKGFELNDKNWTWADYAEMVRTMSDPAENVFGTWMRLNLEGCFIGLRSLGTDILSADGTKCQISSPEARPFFEMAYSLISEKAAPIPTDVGDWKPPFAAQKIMSANDNGYRESFLREMVEDFDFDTFVTPNEGSKPRGVFVCDFTAITSFSKHKDLAWEWEKGILTVEEGIKRVKEARHIPLPVEAAMLPEGEEVSPQYEFYIKEWLANPPEPACLPANGRTTEVFDVLSKGLDAAWLGTEALDEALTRVNDQIQTILDKSKV